MEGGERGGKERGRERGEEGERGEKDTNNMNK